MVEIFHVNTRRIIDFFRVEKSPVEPIILSRPQDLYFGRIIFLCDENERTRTQIAKTPYLDEKRNVYVDVRFPCGGGSNIWVSYKIPLSDYGLGVLRSSQWMERTKSWTEEIGWLLESSAPLLFGED